MNNFQELDLLPQLHAALADEHYIAPTPIQAKAIPPALLGRDVLGCAQTGTGKTAAFALPILNQLGKEAGRAAPGRPLALVLAPTRELAIQIAASFATYGRHLPIRRAVVYGGVNQLKQVQALARGAHVLVATPGRLLDLMEQGHVRLDQLQVFVLDEVDRMLDMGFLPDLKRIIRQLPAQRQSLFFSATLPPKITELARGLLRNPVSVNVTPASPSVASIQQGVIFVEKGGKQDLLRKMLTSEGVERALVFTKTKRGANTLAQKLLVSGIRAAAIHGNKSQNARQQALSDFERRRVQVLVATDVASRGIDIDGISHVVNFDLPVEPEAYVHRIGRTGRAGEKGMALSFCTDSERGALRAIESLIGRKLTQLIQKSAGERTTTTAVATQPARQRSDRAAHPSGNQHGSTNGNRPGKPRGRRHRRFGQGTKSTAAAAVSAPVVD